MRTGSPKQLGHGQPERWDPTGVLIDEDALPEMVDFAGLFGNDRPVEIEIGTGKGTFILQRGKDRREINLLGIEYARAYCAYSADRCRRAGLSNVRMLHTDAVAFLTGRVPEASVWRVHIYFPDPWPKRRHHRRRSIKKSFLREIRRVLRVGGQLLVVTDHEGYYRQIRGVLEGAKGFATIPFPQLAGSGDETEIVGTNFERKYVREGRSFYRAALMKYH